MLSMSRACVFLAATTGIQIFAVGAVTAAQISGSEVEALETILSYFALLFLGIFGTCVGFARWFLRRWDPKNVDPVTLLMLENMKDDTTVGPLLDRLEAIEERQRKTIEIMMKKDAEQDGLMGSGEQYLKSGD